jgi:hypothetical protein
MPLVSETSNGANLRSLISYGTHPVFRENNTRISARVKPFRQARRRGAEYKYQVQLKLFDWGKR